MLFTLLVFVGIAIKNLKLFQIVVASVAAPTLYFLISNFLVWASNGATRGLNRPKNFNGLLLCYTDGIPFYKMSILATLVFSAILFGSFILVRNYQTKATEIKS